MSLSDFFPRSSFKMSSQCSAETLFIKFKKTIKNHPVKVYSASKLYLRKMSLKKSIFSTKVISSKSCITFSISNLKIMKNIFEKLAFFCQRQFLKINHLHNL